ncbi:MAG: TusE/DsrC/DsvC family sulfur relay protein [Pseudomonadota bacterium]
MKTAGAPLEVHGRPLDRDTDGYLKSLADWNADVARALAADEGIVLGDEHFAVIEVIRAFYREYRISPATRVLVKAVARALGPDKGNSAWLMQRFASTRYPTQSPALVVARIAGLPRPANCT